MQIAMDQSGGQRGEERGNRGHGSGTPLSRAGMKPIVREACWSRPNATVASQTSDVTAVIATVAVRGISSHRLAQTNSIFLTS